MRFYCVADGTKSRLAVREGDHYIDLQLAYKTMLYEEGHCASPEAAEKLAATLISHDLRDVIEMGQKAKEACEDAVRFAQRTEDRADAPWVLSSDRDVKAPLKTPRKFICIGLNYAAHAAEGGRPVPEEPIFFSKVRDVDRRAVRSCRPSRTGRDIEA